MTGEGVHPDCRNSSNPVHECTEYCFNFIAEVKKQMIEKQQEVALASDDAQLSKQEVKAEDEKDELEGGSDVDTHNADEEYAEIDLSQYTGKKKKFMELKKKMYDAKRANQQAMVLEKKRLAGPQESRGISKQKWMEDRKKKIGRLLDANGLDMSKAYMLDTQQMAETKYKKWEKEPAPHGWDVFNQKTLYDAYKKRTKNINVDVEEYNKMKEADPEFYREASSLQYGKAPKISDSKIEKMVKELKDRDEKKQSFSRRRKFREEKDVDSINDRNEHFNKKIERAFGKYTLEIKNNLERGTALPD
jgi:pre-mRNA-splicing factor SYF2